MNILKRIISSYKAPQKISVNNDKRSAIEIASIEQIDFANAAVSIFHEIMQEYGFKLLKLEITKYGSKIVWTKGKQYLDLGGNTHPVDAPYYYGILLGEFKGDYYHYSDQDCVGLWKMKSIQNPLELVKDTPFPFREEIHPSLIQTKNDLLKYAKEFLEGDMTRFYNARTQQWGNNNKGSH